MLQPDDRYSPLQIPPQVAAASAWPGMPPGGRSLAPAAPRVWPVFVGFAVAFIVGAVGAALVGVMIAVALHGPQVVQQGLSPTTQVTVTLESAMLEPAVFLPVLVATQVVLAAVALGGAALSPISLVRRLRLGRPKLPWYGYAIVAVGTIAIGYVSGVMIELLGLGDQGTLQEFDRALSGLRGPVLAMAAAVVGLGPGFGEELLFRGYIQTRLRQRWPRLVALGVTAGLFGFIHFDLVQGSFAVALGLWLGEVADRTGSVWPGVFAHAFNNATATVLSALAGSKDQHPTPSDAWTWVALGAAGLVLAACLLYVLRRPVLPTEPEPHPLPAAQTPLPGFVIG